MFSLSVLSEMIDYYDRTKGIGHTRTVFEGLDGVPNAIVVVGRNEQRNELYFRDCNVLSVYQIGTGKLKGEKRPIIFDNYALTILFEDILEEFKYLKERNKELRNEVEDLKDKLNI